MLQESYDWFLANADRPGGEQASPDRSPLRQGVLWLVKQLS